MKVTLNRQKDALYFRLEEKSTTAEADEVEPGVVLDFDDAGRVAVCLNWTRVRRLRRRQRGDHG